MVVFVCPVCEIDNRVTASFCRQCGQPRAYLEELAAAGSSFGQEREYAFALERNGMFANQHAEDEVYPENNQTIEKIHSISVSELSANASDRSELDKQQPLCSSCDRALRYTDKFCCSCGEPQLNRTSPPSRVCFECSTVLADKANYCHTCGAAAAASLPDKIRVPIELFRDERSELFPTFDA